MRTHVSFVVAIGGLADYSGFSLEHANDPKADIYLAYSFAVAFTSLMNCLTTPDASPRRDASASDAFGLEPPLSGRYRTPSIFMRCNEDGTIEMPEPAATRLKVEVMRGACWVDAPRLPTRGLNPAARHAAIVASYMPVPGGP